MTKGGMTLIDEACAASIYRNMGPATEMSGGSGATIPVGIAGFGARAAFIGKVREDQIGRLLYAHDIRAAGVAFETRPAPQGLATGCSYILVTPDGERTMNTYPRRGAGTDAGRYRPSPGRRLRDRLSREGYSCRTLGKAPKEVPLSRPRPSRMMPAARWR